MGAGEKERLTIAHHPSLRLCHKNRFSPEEITERDVETVNREYQTRCLKRPKTWLQ